MPDHLFNGLRVTVRTAVLSPFLPKNFHNQPLAARSAKQRIAQSLHGHYWFREPSLRRRVQAGLNKGEARNALARAVFIRRQGEIRERGQVNGDLQIQRLSYMALLTSPTEFSLNLRCVGCVNGMYGKLFRGKSARKG